MRKFYEGIAFDFAYMNKPLIYYHFDYHEYRKKQHPEGYFKYENDGFGPIVETKEKLCEYIDEIIDEELLKKLTPLFQKQLEEKRD